MAVVTSSTRVVDRQKKILLSGPARGRKMGARSDAARGCRRPDHDDAD
jgi:hypothetical protein